VKAQHERFENQDPPTRETGVVYGGRQPVTPIRRNAFAALLAAGHDPSATFENQTKTARGGFCGMGVCQECRVTVDGCPTGAPA
jgi:hypothetical protein